jgi:3-polyprenyl-4-hydroxybenzoate decarboxylase
MKYKMNSNLQARSKEERTNNIYSTQKRSNYICSTSMRVNDIAICPFSRFNEK